MSIDTLSGNNGNFVINTDILNDAGVTVVKVGTEIYHAVRLTVIRTVTLLLMAVTKR